MSEPAAPSTRQRADRQIGAFLVDQGWSYESGNLGDLRVWNIVLSLPVEEGGNPVVVPVVAYASDMLCVVSVSFRIRDESLSAYHEAAAQVVDAVPLARLARIRNGAEWWLRAEVPLETVPPSAPIGQRQLMMAFHTAMAGVGLLVKTLPQRVEPFRPEEVAFLTVGAEFAPTKSLLPAARTSEDRILWLRELYAYSEGDPSKEGNCGMFSAGQESRFAAMHYWADKGFIKTRQERPDEDPTDWRVKITAAGIDYIEALSDPKSGDIR